MNQTDFSEIADCSAKTIQAIELDKLGLSESLAAKISLETGVDVGWLLANNIDAEIPVSHTVLMLYPSFDACKPPKWTPSTYKFIQEKRDEIDFQSIYREQVWGLRDYARLRKIIESARQLHRYDLARYKLDRFLKDMEAEFGLKKGSSPFAKNITGVGWQSIDFVEAELSSAKYQASLFLDVKTMEDEVELEEMDAARAIQEAVSPYEDRSDPGVAARIAEILKALAQENERRGNAGEMPEPGET